MQMENEYYFPVKRVSEISSWFLNFMTNLSPVYGNFDIAITEFTELEKDNAAVQYTVGRITAYADAQALFIKTRDTMWLGDPENKNLAEVGTEPQVPVIPVEDVPLPIRPNINRRLKSLVQRLREHPKMTSAMALKLGILPNPRPEVVSASYKPQLTGSLVNGLVVLECAIKDFGGYEIWRKIGESNDYTKLGTSVGRQYTDTTPLAEGVQVEVRKYRVRMLDSNNQPFGEFSAELTVMVTRPI